MNSFTLAMALIMGLTSSLHCAGMCGPIVLIMPFHRMNGFKKWLGILSYHFGRTSVYALLGLSLFSFKSFFQPHIQQYISVSLGSILFIAGILSLFPSRFTAFSLPWTDFVKQQLGRFIGKAKISSLLITGALNGLLPCGMVYMALSAAITTSGSVWETTGLMYAFGLGTAPALIAITVLKGKVAFLRNNRFKKLVPVAMLFFGCIFILRGLSLGIPYLSPKIYIETSSQGVPVSCYNP